MSVLPLNPCLTCGACCAYYRASFYWSEADPASGGTVPPEMTEQVTPCQVAMKGTNASSPRCIALKGEIGVEVGCSIYAERASVCREFPFAWQDGVANPRCDAARAAWGLPALQPLVPIETGADRVVPLQPGGPNDPRTRLLPAADPPS